MCVCVMGGGGGGIFDFSFASLDEVVERNVFYKELNPINQVGAGWGRGVVCVCRGGGASKRKR